MNYNPVKTGFGQLFVLLLSLFVLSGCGGSSGSNDVTTNPPIGAKLAMRISDEQNQTISNAEATSAVFISVVATNDFGRPVSGATITFATDLGSLSQDSALTDSSGTATVRLLTTSTQLGVAAITSTATIDTKALTISGQVEINELTVDTASLNLTLLDDSCTNPVTSIVAGSTLCVKASLFQGITPLEGEVIDLTNSKGTLRTDSVLTDATGIATTYVDSTVDLLGAATITATSGSLTKSLNYEFSAFTPEPEHDPLVSLTLHKDDCDSPAISIEAGGSFCLKAELTQNDEFLANEVITFAAPIGTLRQTTVLTGSDGTARSYLDSINSISGAAAVTASFGNFSAAENYQFTPPPAGIGATLTLGIFDEDCITQRNSNVAGSTFCLKAIVVRENKLLQNVIVEFLAPLGTLRQTSALTDEFGTAKAMLDSTSTTFGAAIASASYENISKLQNYQFTEISAQSSTQLDLVIRDEECQFATHDTAAGKKLCLTVTLTHNDEPLAGKIVTFSAPLGTLDQLTALTDDNGYAQVILDSTTDDLGANTATVTYEQFIGSANYEFTKGDPAAITTVDLSIREQTCTGEVISVIAGNELCILATIRVGGVIQVGKIVDFVATLGELSPASGLTDEHGVAKVFIKNGPTLFGAATVTATYLGDSTSKNYELTAAQDTRDLSMVTLDSDCLGPKVSFAAGTPVCLAATMLDKPEGEGMAGQVVSFSAPLGTLLQQAALTDANGVAHALITSTSEVLGASTATAANTSLITTANYEFVTVEDTPLANPTLKVSAKQGNQSRPRFKVGESVTIEAKLFKPDGSAFPNQITRFSVERGLLSTDSALTGDDGVATTVLSADAIHVGAGVATAQVIIEGVPYTETINYEILASDTSQLDSVKIGYFDDNGDFIEGKIGTNLTKDDNDEVELSAGGTLGLTVVVVDQNLNRITSPAVVSFTSGCSTSGGANLDAEVSTINGQSRSTYQDISCATVEGNQDNIVAGITVNNLTQTATLVVNINPETAGSIEFISAEPTSIVLQGSGGQGKQETSTLTFSIRGSLGNPLAQQPVSFELDSGVGNMTVNPKESLTNSQGLVSTKVTAGNVPTAVRVTATTASEDSDGNAIEIKTQSDLLSVNTGLPDQNSITLSTDTFNPESGDLNGIEVFIRAYMGDSFNNPVPDGTTINFTTEGGFVQPSCNTLNGNCNIFWTSAEPRVNNHRITITATAIGHETFFDTNGNNVFDDADGNTAHNQGSDSGLDRGEYASSGFVDHSEAWRDDNENRQHDEGEVFIDFNNDKTFNAADQLFNGPQCTHASLCSELTQKINVRKSLVMIMSGSTVKYTIMTSNLTSSSNQALDYIGGNFVLYTNETDREGVADVVVDGGIAIQSNGSAIETVEGMIRLDEEQRITLTIAIADNAIPLGQTLPAGTTMTIVHTDGSLVGTSEVAVPNSIGVSYKNRTGADEGKDLYGGTKVTFTLINTNTLASEGDSTQQGQLRFNFLLPTTQTSSEFVIPYTMVGDGG